MRQRDRERERDEKQDWTGRVRAVVRGKKTETKRRSAMGDKETEIKQ